MNDLDAIPTEDLIAEIKRRHESYILVTAKPSKLKADDSTVYEYSWYGGYHAGLGLCDMLRTHLYRCMSDDRGRGDADE